MIERHAPPLGPGVAERFAFGKAVSDAEFTRGASVRKAFRSKLARLLGRDGVLLLPTVPDIAPLVSAGEPELDDFRNRALRLLCLAGLSGFPQISVPVAHRDDAPLGLSVIGPKGSDKSLVAFAVKLESGRRGSGWHRFAIASEAVDAIMEHEPLLVGLAATLLARAAGDRGRTR